MTDATNSTIDFFIVVVLFIIDAFHTLITGIKKEESKLILPKKSNAELNKMLKKDLVELVLTYQN